MSYYPTLSDRTKKKLDEVKKSIKAAEERGDENPDIWRRNNNTFDTDKIIRYALINYEETFDE